MNYSQRYECGIENPQRIPLLTGGKLWGFWCFGIGMNKLRELPEDEQCKFVLFVGTKGLIKRRLFEQYPEQAYSI